MTGVQADADTELTRFLHDTMPYMKLIGVEAVSAAAEGVHLRMAWDDTRCTSGGLLHGGALMSLADGGGGWCAFLNLPEGASTATIESKTNLLRAVRDGSVESISTPLHVGRTFIVIDSDIRDATGRLVARTTQTQAVIAPR